MNFSPIKKILAADYFTLVQGTASFCAILLSWFLSSLDRYAGELKTLACSAER